MRPASLRSLGCLPATAGATASGLGLPRIDCRRRRVTLGRYVELHCHSAFSLREGASTPEELMLQAKALGYQALALTDHDSAWPAPCSSPRRRRSEELQAIIGAEVTLADGSHLTLLCETPRGYANLSRLLTPRQPRTRHAASRALRFEWLAEHAEGLIALSGCRKGEVAALVERGELRRRTRGRRALPRRLRPRELLHRAAGQPGLRGPGAQRRAGRPRARARPRRRRDQQRPLRTCRASIACTTCWSPCVTTPTWRRRGPTCAPTPSSTSSRRRRWSASSPTCRRRSRTRRVSPSAAALRPDARPELRVPGLRLRRRPRAPTSSCATPATELAQRPLLQVSAPGARRQNVEAAPGEGAEPDQVQPPRRLLPAPLGHPALRPRQRPAGARPRLLGRLAGLLPARPLRHRPDQVRPRGRALPQRGPARERRAGRRPRFRPRGARQRCSATSSRSTRPSTRRWSAPSSSTATPAPSATSARRWACPRARSTRSPSACTAASPRAWRTSWQAMPEFASPHAVSRSGGTSWSW